MSKTTAKTTKPKIIPIKQNPLFAEIKTLIEQSKQHIAIVSMLWRQSSWSHIKAILQPLVGEISY
jgi:hypothetical protein